jgi:hypothetical protein
MKVELFDLPTTVLQDFEREMVGPTLAPTWTNERIVFVNTLLGGPVTSFTMEMIGTNLLMSPMHLDKSALSFGLSDGRTLPLVTFSDLNLSLFAAEGSTTFGAAMSTLAFSAALGIDDNGVFAAAYLQSNDTLIGSSAANFLYGGAGTDTITGGGGADYIHGGAGADTSVYREFAHSQYLTSRLADGTVRVATKDGTTDTNIAVETLQFDDGSMATSSLSYLPGFTEPTSGSTGTIYRFYNNRDKAFFYTSSVAERDMIIRESTDPAYTPDNGVWPYFYQGATFEQAHSSSGATSVFRFYNTKTGHHFFTTSVAERDMVQKESTDPNYGQPGVWPFVYEGVAFNAFADASHNDALPVFRFYSPTLDRHFFTGNAAEANEIKLTGLWTAEGIGYWGEVPGP